MRNAALTLATVTALALAVACENTSGLSEAPRATFSQVACLDLNNDDRINAADAADPSQLPDFNADDDRDADDAAFLQGVDIELDPARDKEACEGRSGDVPEYLVAHGYFEGSDVTCDAGRQAVLLVGVGGGVVNLDDVSDAAGIRSIVDALMQAYDDAGVQTIGVIAGPAVVGARQHHGAMEAWVANATRMYLERFPCLRTVLIGHSHGAVTVDVSGARLEEQFADRIIAVVDVDRVEELYNSGDLQSRPVRASVFNIYETNDPLLRGVPYDSPNVENWDATAETGPKDGVSGGEPEPVRHTTIDNAESVKDRIVSEVMERSGITG